MVDPAPIPPSQYHGSAADGRAAGERGARLDRPESRAYIGAMRGAPFIKMHGLGNDFVVLDARRAPSRSTTRPRAIADRHPGVGCDQLIVIEPPRAPRRRRLHAHPQRRWRRGRGVRQCRALRRIAVDARDRQRRVALETGAGLLEAEARADGLVTVDMGPGAHGLARHSLGARHGHAACRACRSGRSAIPSAPAWAIRTRRSSWPTSPRSISRRSGRELEHDPLFPARANIGVAQILAPARLRLRVWERGAGLTPACGTGACAALVAAARRGLTGRSAEIVADGGTMFAEWREDGHVLMTGPAAVSFSGTLDPSLLACVMTVEIVTFGCRLNAFESEAIRGIARAAGLDDAVIVNTCAVTSEAERQARQAIRRARREHPERALIVTGCAAQIAPERYAAMAEVDQVLGNREKFSPAIYAAGAPRRAVGSREAMREEAAPAVEGCDGNARGFSPCSMAATIPAPSASSPKGAAPTARCRWARSCARRARASPAVIASWC